MTKGEAEAELSGLEPTDEDFAQSPGRRTEERAALIQATRNLLDGKPEKAVLRDLMEENDGWLPITKETVEIEAGSTAGGSPGVQASTRTSRTCSSA